MGAYNVCAPVVALARTQGHEVSVVAEGLAVQRFKDAGTPLFFEGSENSETHPFLCDVETTLSHIDPDVVVIGLSTPNNLEGRFARAANVSGRPVIGIHDIWGCYVRTPKVRFDTLCVVDDADHQAVLQSGVTENAVISGTAGAKTVRIPEGLREEMQRIREKFPKVLVYSGGNPVQVEAEIRLLLASIEMTPGSCLISRPHGKYVKLSHPKGGTYGEYWQGLVSVLGERLITIQTSVPNSDPIAVLADCLLSGYSTVGITTMFNGIPTVVLDTVEGREDLFSSTRMTDFPHAVLGAPRVSEPTDLTPFLVPSSPVLKTKLVPFSPDTVLEAVLKVRVNN